MWPGVHCCGLYVWTLDWYLSDGSCCQGDQQAILCCGGVLQICTRVSSHTVGREEPRKGAMEVSVHVCLSVCSSLICVCGWGGGGGRGICASSHLSPAINSTHICSQMNRPMTQKQHFSPPLPSPLPSLPPPPLTV